MEGRPRNLFQLVGRVQALGPGPCLCALSISCCRDLVDGRDTVRSRLRVRVHFKRRYDYDSPPFTCFYASSCLLYSSSHLNTTTHTQVSFYLFSRFFTIFIRKVRRTLRGHTVHDSAEAVLFKLCMGAILRHYFPSVGIVDNC